MRLVRLRQHNSVKRRLLNLLTGLSLLLCLYAAVCWVVAVHEGGPYLRGYDVFQPLEPPRVFTSAELNGYRPPLPTFNFGGFRIQQGFRAEYMIEYGRVYTVPFWFLSLLFGVASSVWLRGRWHEWRRARRVRLWEAGVCPDCGYDLRATPGQCPECGTIAPGHAT
jgi:hypothetical protein